MNYMKEILRVLEGEGPDVVALEDLFLETGQRIIAS
jgi:hypothetical protein